MKTVGVILPSYRRHENIPIIIKRLKESTVKPTRIIVWNDNETPPGMDLDKENFDKDIEIINTNSNNWSNWGSFIICYFLNTDYIAIIDDDMLLGKKWLEFCIENIGSKKHIYGGFGIKLKSNKYLDRKSWKSKLSKEKKFVEVDMAGCSYFFPRDAILPMFSKRPPWWSDSNDLHFSFMARKVGWKCFVPFPTEKEQLPFSPGLPISADERAMYKVAGHFERRNAYIKWAIENKIIESVI